MYYQLVSLNETQRWNLRLPAIAGRDPEAQVSIDDVSISRSHCQFSLNPDEALQVRDLGSMNGTYVNGERLRLARTLLPGDVVQIGGVAVRVEYATDLSSGERNSQRPSAIEAKSPRSMASTQPMVPVKKETFTMHEVPQPSKSWWEFWKTN